MSTTTTTTTNSSWALPIMMASVIISAVVNTILRRIALVPLEHYPFFLTQVQTLVYALFYGCMLWYRYYHTGQVTTAMLQIRKSPFVWIGLWDSVGDLLGNLGTSRLPGYQVPILSKLNIVFTAFFSHMLLGKHYSYSQIASMLVVICGSIVTLIPRLMDVDSSSVSGGFDLFYVLIYVASVAPTGLAFVIKEQVFHENAHLNLDIFVVNTIGSLVAVFFTLLLLPVAAVPGLGKVPLSELPQYLVNGAICFAGTSPTADDEACSNGSPLAPSLYIIVNIAFNLAMLTLVKHGGAVLTFITNTVTFPLATIFFTLNLPLLGSSSIDAYIVLGLCIEMAGILLYRQASLQMAQEEEMKIGKSENVFLKDKDEKYGAVEITEVMEAHEKLCTSPVPCCYNELVRKLVQCRKYNSEELCKSLLASKCNCVG